MLTEEQEQYVIDQITRGQLAYKQVQDDLIDHFCCVIEELIQDGKAFDEAFQEAYQQTTPNGVEEIELETFFLLNLNKTITMKKFMYVTAALFSPMVIAAVCFKLLHLPGAAILLVLGVGGLIIFPTPVFLALLFKNPTRRMTSKLKWLFGIVGLSLMVVTIVLKLLHLSGGGMGIFITSVVLALGFLPMLFVDLYKALANKELLAL